MKTFVFNLVDEVEYSSDGEMATGSSITFSAPKPNQRRKTTQIKQSFFRALPKDAKQDQDQDKNKSDDEEVISGSEVLFLIAQSNDVDYPSFIETGRSLVCDEVGKIDEVGNFTTVVADRLPINVLEEIIGEYVANFILRSAIQSIIKS